MGKLICGLFVTLPESDYKHGLSLDVPIPVDFSSENEAANLPLYFILKMDGVHVLLEEKEFCFVNGECLFLRPLKAISRDVIRDKGMGPLTENGVIVSDDTEVQISYYDFMYANKKRAKKDLHGDYTSYAFIS